MPSSGPAAVAREIPLSGMRGTIARRMHASLQEMAQLTHGYEVRMDGVAAARAQLKAEWEPARLAVPSLGDFVVTSLGGYGVDFFTPIISPGNVAILGVGRLRDGVDRDGDVPRRTQVLTLSLTFDHRAVDGAPAAEYLRTVGRLLEQPLRPLGAPAGTSR